MLNMFKEKLNAPAPSKTAQSVFNTFILDGFSNLIVLSLESTTPEGTPPRDFQMTPQQQTTPAAAVSNTSSILEALANMARQNTSVPSASATVPAPSSSYNMPSMPNVPNVPLQQMASINPTFPFPPSTQSVNMPAPAATFASQSHGTSSSAQNFPSNPAAPYGTVAPPLPQETNTALQQQILIFKTLADQGIPQDQWAGVIAALNAAGGLLPQPQIPANQNQNGWGARPEDSRDRNGYAEPIRSPPGRYRRRSRSPSPARAWGARDSPSSRRRDEQGYGDYDRGRDSPGRGLVDERGRGRGNEYRQRSPRARRGRSPTPPGNYEKGQITRSGEKWVEYDPTIGKENIKGKSMTQLPSIPATNDYV
jgi:protein NRD1